MTPTNPGHGLPPLEELAIDDVSFTYPGTEPEVLHHVSTTIRAGEVVAIVGHNGSGKTTLAKLLAGLYTPTSGAIRWNGVDRETYDRHDIRRAVGVVFQDFVRYELSVTDNVGFGDIRRLDDRSGIDGALRVSGARLLRPPTPPRCRHASVALVRGRR